MPIRQISENTHWIGTLDPERRIFDEILPTPDGTSYNSYLVKSGGIAALIDGADPKFTPDLMESLDRLGADRIDYLVANHAEQDHSGSLPALLGRYPDAKLVATPRCAPFLTDLLGIPVERVTTVEDGTVLPLGGGELKFIHFPCAHWPETMLTYFGLDRVLFPCDLFGSHLADYSVRTPDDPGMLEQAKRYYAGIMMPFRVPIGDQLPGLDSLDIDLLAPSHGPVIASPGKLLAAYRKWTTGEPENLATIVYVSMHDSTRRLVFRLAESLGARGVRTEIVPLGGVDPGNLALALVDAMTIVIGSPTVLGGAHPAAAYAAFLANMLKPKARYAALVGSYGWGGRAPDQLAGMLVNLKLEILGSIFIKGAPRKSDLAQMDQLAEKIAAKHRA
jgi:flavorubredoxin